MRSGERADCIFFIARRKPTFLCVILAAKNISQAFFFCAAKVWKPSTTRIKARTAIAAAKTSWNQSPQTALPAPIREIFFIIVKARLTRVAQSMKIIGKKNILLFFCT